MAITKFSSGSSFTNLTKYDDFLAGNAAYDPGAFVSIASFTPTGTTTVTFSSIPSTYKHLQIRLNVLTATSGDNIAYRFNGDTSGNYAYHTLNGNGATASASPNGTNVNSMKLDAGTVVTSSTMPAVAIIDVIDYASTTKYKTSKVLEGYDRNGSGEVALISNLWPSTSAITSVTLFTSTYNFSSGTTIALYGIKGA